MHKLHVIFIAAAALLLADDPVVKTGQTTRSMKPETTVPTKLDVPARTQETM